MLNQIMVNVLPYMPQKLVWMFSSRYIAGETIEDGLQVSKTLNQDGMEVTIDLLGEFIETPEEAERNKNYYLEIITRFLNAGVVGNFSLKPTMFGLLFDEGMCIRFIREVVNHAARGNNFIRIDMEDSRCVDPEIALFKALQKDFPQNVGLVLQAYLRRTRDDLEKLSVLNSESAPLNFRLCKGIYVESEAIAFKKYPEVREHFLEDMEYMFKNKMYVGIATHDKWLVGNACRLIETYKIPKSMYEFQMLYGVTPDLRQSIIDEGHLMRVYVPFGEKWFNYCTRRLKENPKMAQQIIKALFIRG